MKIMLEEVAKERLSRIGLQPNLFEPLTGEGSMAGRWVIRTPVLLWQSTMNTNPLSITNLNLHLESSQRYKIGAHTQKRINIVRPFNCKV